MFLLMLTLSFSAPYGINSHLTCGSLVLVTIWVMVAWALALLFMVPDFWPKFESRLWLWICNRVTAVLQNSRLCERICASLQLMLAVIGVVSFLACLPLTLLLE